MKLKLHLGCGYCQLEGWINVDLNRSCKPDLVADLSKPFPFKSNSVDYIHSEDFVDQIELADGYVFFQESYRILKDNGVMRVLTPDLNEFAKRYLKRDKGLIELWSREVGIPLRTRTHCELFNLGMRLLGHRFLYDEPTLTHVLIECGFRPKKVAYQSSDEKELSGLDVRSPQTAISLYYECDKREWNHSSRFWDLFPRLKKILKRS